MTPLMTSSCTPCGVAVIGVTGQSNTSKSRKHRRTPTGEPPASPAQRGALRKKGPPGASDAELVQAAAVAQGDLAEAGAVASLGL